jgi:8-oxo-dGTP pyrophosphatase MutT (NUDIX family)
LPFLPEGGIAETYISNTLPDEALITSVFGFVFSKDQVLFTRGEADHAHTLEIPGGHKESGENTTETVLREIQEETSIVPEKYVYVGYVKITVPENTVEYAYMKKVFWKRIMLMEHRQDR